VKGRGNELPTSQQIRISLYGFVIVKNCRATCVSGCREGMTAASVSVADVCRGCCPRTIIIEFAVMDAESGMISGFMMKLQPRLQVWPTGLTVASTAVSAGM
jgi:hypothetical protein